MVKWGAYNVEGLGESTVAVLLEKGLIQKASDLFSLDAARLASIPRFGALSCKNLTEAIAGTRANRTLAKFIFSLGIEGCGASTAKNLATAFGTWLAFSSSTREALMAVPDVGDITADTILDFFATTESCEEAHRLASFIEPQDEARAPAGALFSGMTIVLTGSLPTLARDAAKALIEAAGGKVAGSVSAKTTAVVAGSEAGSKLEKAIALSVPVWDEAELLQRLASVVNVKANEPSSPVLSAPKTFHQEALF